MKSVVLTNGREGVVGRKERVYAESAEDTEYTEKKEKG
jgi:hypothetical protein